MILLCTVMALALAWALFGARRAPRPARDPFRDTGALYRRCYDRRGFLRLGALAAGAAALAFSGADEAVDRWYRSRVRSRGTDRLSDALRPFGERKWFFFWGAFALADAYVGRTALTRWGRRNFQAMVVGLPALWSVQYLGGASRPRDDAGGARWHPLRDDNTASGHTFVSCIPWLTAGRSLDRRRLRGAVWVLSWGTGWSRINDREHYLSQVLLGHEIAARAVAAVDAVEPARTSARDS